MEKENCWLSLLIEGDSQLVINVATKLLKGTNVSKVLRSWRFQITVERLKKILDVGLVVRFNHVRMAGNKVAYKFVNIGMESHLTKKARDWNELTDVMDRDTYTHLLYQDMHGNDEEGREGWGSGPST